MSGCSVTSYNRDLFARGQTNLKYSIHLIGHIYETCQSVTCKTIALYGILHFMPFLFLGFFFLDQISYLGQSGTIPESSAHSCRFSPDRPGTPRRSRVSPGRRCHSSGHVGYSIWSWMGYLHQTGKKQVSYSVAVCNTSYALVTVMLQTHLCSFAAFILPSFPTSFPVSAELLCWRNIRICGQLSEQ